MKLKNLIFTIALFPIAQNALAACPQPWVCKTLNIDIPFSTVRVSEVGTPMPTLSIEITHEEIRAGYYPESGTFRGNVLYYQGLGDSMLNHEPLFRKLSAAGFRVIAFDYMGQGGSSGQMNRTRIQFIESIGQQVWKQYAKDLEHFPKLSIIGWSTGGLVAYRQASYSRADQVVLIAPGIAPNVIVGGGILSWPPDNITLESLTSAAPYQRVESNPHRDGVRPRSPIEVPEFAYDLLRTAHVLRKTKIPGEIRGLVLLSGKNDTYVNAELTKKRVRRNAPQFKVLQFENALHEIDNEKSDVANAAHSEILSFLLAQ